VVVVRRDLGVVQEREQLTLVPPFNQPARGALRPRLRQQLPVPLHQPTPLGREPLRGQLPEPFARPDRIADQPTEEKIPVKTPMIDLRLADHQTCKMQIRISSAT